MLKSIILLSIFLSFCIFSNCDSFEDFIKKQEDSLKEICNQIIYSHSQYVYDELETCPYYDACDSNLENNLPDISTTIETCVGNVSTLHEFPANQTQCDCVASDVSFYEPLVTFPKNVNPNSPQIKEFLCITASSKEILRKNLQEDLERKRQYIVSDYGAMISFPGTNWKYDNSSSRCRMTQLPCENVEPRNMDWYISGSSSPKNVIILVDKSGSLGEDIKMQLIKDAVHVAIDGLTFRDRVGLVFFDKVPRVCMNGALRTTQATIDLISSTEQSRTKLHECVDSVNPSGESNFENAFEYGFSMLELAKSKNNYRCISAILFFTDGKRTNGYDPISIVEERNTMKAKVFTFVAGSQLDHQNMRNIACNSGGLAFTLRGIGNPRTEMTKYYQLLAFDQKTNQVSWSSKYVNPEYEQIVTGGLSCHSEDGALLAVAGIDVPVQRLQSYPDWEDKLHSLQNRSEVCTEFEPTESYTRLLRGGNCNYCDPSLCGASLHTFLGIATVCGLLICVSTGFLLSYVCFSQLRKLKAFFKGRSPEVEAFLHDEPNNLNANLDFVNNERQVNEAVQTLDSNSIELQEWPLKRSSPSYNGLPSKNHEYSLNQGDENRNHDQNNMPSGSQTRYSHSMYQQTPNQEIGNEEHSWAQTYPNVKPEILGSQHLNLSESQDAIQQPFSSSHLDCNQTTKDHNGSQVQFNQHSNLSPNPNPNPVLSPNISSNLILTNLNTVESPSSTQTEPDSYNSSPTTSIL